MEQTDAPFQLDPSSAVLKYPQIRYTRGKVDYFRAEWSPLCHQMATGTGGKLQDFTVLMANFYLHYHDQEQWKTDVPSVLECLVSLNQAANGLGIWRQTFPQHFKCE